MEQSKLGIKPSSYRAIIDCAIAFAIWLVILLLLNLPGLADDYGIFWVFVVLPLIPIYGYLYGRAIPRIIQKTEDFWHYQLRIIIRAVPALLVLFISYYLYLLYLGTYRPYIMGIYILLALCFLGLLLIIIAPAAWLGYHYRLAKQHELALEAEADQSSVNLDLSGPQINPPFLANALNVFKKPVTFKKVEFWVVTIIYSCSALVLLGQVLDPFRNSNLFGGNYYFQFRRNHIPYSFARDSALPQACKLTIQYIGFILFNFFIAESLLKGRKILLNLILLFGLYLIVAIALGTADTWLRGYLLAKNSEEVVYDLLFKSAVFYTFTAFAVLTVYNLAKLILRLIISILEKTFPVDEQVTTECLVALGLWALTSYFLFISYFSWKASVMLCEASLYGIILYWYLCNKVIPYVIAAAGKFREYLLSVLVILFISTIPLSLISYLIFQRLNATFYINLTTISLNLFIVAPFAWFFYSYRLSKSKELTGLKTALGQSSANLDFLRSQINPHFLFNALNTLYATAIQENADRTGEGIQKLGDMMRFMLQENVQELISLSREVDYLNNYIALQKLRTQTSTDIIIQTDIEEQENYLQIAPMLLIPFVENAFKHGISLKEPSHIKITLHTKGTELFFDVTNSVHPKKDNDPEKDRSGIGLENVSDRLRLLYLNHHDLVIRESAKEFFIHLTLNLTSNLNLHN